MKRWLLQISRMKGVALVATSSLLFHSSLSIVRGVSFFKSPKVVKVEEIVGSRDPRSDVVNYELLQQHDKAKTSIYLFFSRKKDLTSVFASTIQLVSIHGYFFLSVKSVCQFSGRNFCHFAASSCISFSCWRHRMWMISLATNWSFLPPLKPL